MSIPRLFHVTTLGRHDEALREGLSSCIHGLNMIGYDVSQNHTLRTDAINIVFIAGSSDVHLRQLLKQFEHVILYNWEQILPNVSWVNNWHYFKAMSQYHMWDYSRSNVATLHASGINDVHYLPMTYAPSMTTVVQDIVQDIDVLFYGNLNERRQKTIDAIREIGLNVVTSAEIGSIQGEVRDAYVARAKVVLNMHGQDESTAFEIARASYLLANRKAIVSEINSGNDIDDDLREVIKGGSLSELPQLCADLVANESYRKELETHAFEAFSRRNITAIIKQAVDRYLDQAQKQQLGNVGAVNTPIPNILQVGAVGDGLQGAWQFNCCNAEARTDLGQDLLLDIDKPLPFGQQFKSWRFGAHELTKDYFDKIIANDVLQRVTDLPQTLSNCLMLLKEGGVLEVTVPLDLSYGAWRHVQDKRAFTDQTLTRIIDNWWQYGWDIYRFEIIHSGYGIHYPYGVNYLNEHNHDWNAALKQPRVVDTMSAVLVKRKLTEDERKQRPQIRFMS